MAFAGCALGSELGLRLLLSPAASNVIVRTACVGIGVGFPVYSTFKAIEKKDTVEGEQWLMYWTVYGCFTVAEVFSDTLLSWCPFYYHAKFIFLVWLQFPYNYGAKHMYQNYVRPLLWRYRKRLDKLVDGTRKDINNFIGQQQEKEEYKTIVQTTQNLALSAYQSVGDIIRGPSPSSSSSSDDSSGWVEVKKEDD